MRILVCGGRDYADRDRVFRVLDEKLWQCGHIEYLIEGDARGADKLAGEWALACNVPNWKFPANWKQYGKRAGYLRNAKMLEEGKPDLVVAFPGGDGTAMMCRIAEKSGVEVMRVT